MTVDLASRPTALAGVPPAPPARPTAGARRGAKGLVGALPWDTIRMALGFLTLITVSRIQEEVQLIAIIPWGPLLTLLCLVLAVTQPKTVRWADLTKSPIARRVMVFFGLMCLFAPFGLSIGASGTYILNRFLSTMIYFALIIIAVRHIGDLRFLIGSYVVSMLILIYSGFFLWETTTFNGFDRVGSSGMYDANDLAPIFGAGLPLALLFAQTSGKWGKALGYGVALGTPALIALTGSRGGFLSLLATCLGLLFAVPGISFFKRIGIVVAATIAMAIVAPAGYIQKMGTIFDSKNDYNFTDDSGRLAIWKRGMGFVREHPLTGVGIGNFARAQWEKPSFSITGAQLPTMAPHNTFLEVTAELGIPAFLVFVSVVLTGIVAPLQMRRRLPKRWMKETADRRFLYLAACYFPVTFFGWAVGAFFVSHAYLAPFYLMAAFLATALVLTKKELRLAKAEAAQRQAGQRA